MSEVLAGAADWQVQQWQDSFYPDDLPVEWQLSYYANEFTTTFIRYHDFHAEEDTEDLAEMLEDCPKQFRPVIVYDIDEEKPLDAGELVDWLNVIDSEMGIRRPAGVMLTGRSDMFDHPLLLQWRQRIPSELPVALDITGPSISLEKQWLGANDLSLVWHEDIAAGMAGDHWLARLGLSGDNRQLATQIRTLSSCLSANQINCLIAEKGYEQIDRMRELVTIIRLTIG